jgi:N-acetylmuramic acid 6-phosphate etherase
MKGLIMNYEQMANNFVDNDKQFHLGFLPTEQSSPLTRLLDKTFESSAVEGVRLLQKVDWNVLEMAEKIFACASFNGLVVAGVTALRKGRKIVFSGCGATGRLSILLESMWRRYFLEHPGIMAEQYGESVFSIMTGGDYALIRSVEFFEDYQEFGRQQVRELGMGLGDVLVAITEGGETSSVLGTVDEAARRGAKVFLLFNNPENLLREKLERCRKAIENPAVTVLDLYCGPMALAGSTRMQATTSEQLVAGAALEEILRQIMENGTPPSDFSSEFKKLLVQLAAPEAVEALAKHIEFESEVYSAGGLVTYFADEFLLDIFTDTTERSPTFMLPPFRKSDDNVSPQSWAFVKNPLCPTPEAWKRCFSRDTRCLEWTCAEYARMGAGDRFSEAPPKLDHAELMKFIIGNEDIPSRHQGPEDAAVLVGSGIEKEFELHASSYRRRSCLPLPFQTKSSPLRLLEHLGMKLVLNTVSTGTMVKMGRVSGNWMSYVDVSNKKLLDRGTRLVSELCGLEYHTACIELFKSIEEFKSFPEGDSRPSPVQHTLRRVNGKIKIPGQSVGLKNGRDCG